MAEPLILVLLGGQWTAAAPLFRWLCLGTMAFAVLKTTKWLYVSMGETKRQFHWGLISSPVIIAAVSIGATRSAEGVAIAFAAANWMLVLPGLILCLRGSPLPLRQYAAIAALPAVAAGAGALVIWPVQTQQPFSNSFIELAVTAWIYTAAFVAVWLITPRGRRAARDGWKLARAIRTRPAKVNAAA
jgi:PST family polysaccharide transporter